MSKSLSYGFGPLAAVAVSASVLFAWPAPIAEAGFIPFDTSQSSQYLIIVRMRLNGNTDATTNNFELGANKAPVPSTDSFLDKGSSGGPNLAGVVPRLPANAAAVFQGIGGHGNIAITDPFGEFELQDVGVYADIGIRLAGELVGNGSDLNKSSNAFFNDPNMFPNTFDTNTQTGFTVNPNEAVQATRIDADGVPGNAGVSYSFDHSSLTSELAAANSSISNLTVTGTLDTGGDGVIDTDTTLVLNSGLNVIDIDTGGNDFSLSNVNFVIDGPADSFAIFRLLGNDNMLVTNSNILIGNGGIGLNNVMFFTNQVESDTHFSVSNAILNGVALWSLGSNGGVIDISNAQGSVQLVADIVDMDNVRFLRSSFIPAPGTALVLLTGGTLLGRRRRRDQRGV